MIYVVLDAVTTFGRRVAEVLSADLGTELVGVYFVGSVALGGYVAGESDIDIAAVCERRLAVPERLALASAVADATSECPTRGLEFSLYRREIASSVSSAADFEVNANGGPRMDRLTRVSSVDQPGFWYLLDRAIANRHGIVISGPPASEVFSDLPRRSLLEAMRLSMQWHRTHERATLYSVLNAARAWRFASEDILGSKLEGAAWAQSQWHEPGVIDAAVDLRHGRPGRLDDAAVRQLLDHVEEQLADALRSV